MLVRDFPNVFQSCVVIRAQSRKFEEEVDLSNSFMGSVMPETKTEVENSSTDVIVQPRFDFSFSKQQLISAQNANETLLSCMSSVIEICLNMQ